MNNKTLFKFVACALGAMLCTACGSFQLGNVRPLQAQSKEQMQLDMLTCKDQAFMEANSAGHQAGAFLLGLTIVGAPVAYELDKSTQREVFARCLAARGYTVTPPDDAPKQASALQPSMGQPTATAVIHPIVASPVSKLSLTLPKGWERLPLTKQMSAGEVVLHATNRTIDAGAFLFAAKREGITDLAMFANARRASQANRLTDPQQSDILQVEVNGKRAYRSTVAGALASGVKITYLLTVIEGGTEIAVLNAWTSTANFQNQRATLDTLSDNVTGL